MIPPEMEALLAKVEAGFIQRLLDTMRNPKGRDHVWWSIKRIATQASLDVDSVRGALPDLIERGLILAEQNGANYRYRLTQEGWSGRRSKPH